MVNHFLASDELEGKRIVTENKREHEPRKKDNQIKRQNAKYKDW
jgi:hypothetical protein